MTAKWRCGCGRATVAALAVAVVCGWSAPAGTLSARSAQGGSGAAQGDQARRLVACEMTFTMKGWSAFVSRSEGKGVVTCDNGERADVVLSITGGGVTFGRTEIDDGKGVFSGITSMAEIFGSYAQAEATAGAVEARGAQALTKGNVSLAITTKGRGWSLGVSGARFSIERAKSK